MSFTLVAELTRLDVIVNSQSINRVLLKLNVYDDTFYDDEEDDEDPGEMPEAADIAWGHADQYALFITCENSAPKTLTHFLSFFSGTTRPCRSALSTSSASTVPT